MKMLISLVLMQFAVSLALANDVAIEVGVRSQSGDVESPATAKSQLGYQAGATTAFELSGPWYLRTGMLYTQRNLTVENGADFKYSLNYLDVPVTALYKFEDYAGVFAGVNVSLLFDKSCSGGGCKVEDAKSLMTPFTFGAAFKFAPQIGGTIYFETAPGEAAKGLENFRAIGANISIYFE
ncbi:MAG: outer membrane beta-barrel protein [Bdellovibrionia bacterium]